ncbi:uncharacterized protein LOC118119163 [Hippoglossus stenolepis]|uniref:uncharacterized protein LOC118119163 n=1 Tax=Hippoglossus stenolepis TaxID=195615 RepID=UPI00159C44C4|nr:uncharacterized protein LOC118119163 [Hippoglossus stenolepis]XP_035028770.1 uncharacterized protein LOC118119163 [Hippoglossus stenolepis]
MRVTNYQPDVGKQKPTIVAPNDFRQASSPADRLVVRDAGMRKVQLVQHRLGCTEGDSKRDVLGGSLMNLSTSKPSYRSCIHREVPLRSTSSVVFLDKSLSISLVELEGRGAGQPTLYRSTLSVRLGVTSCCRSKPAKTNGVYRRPRAATTSGNKRNGQEMGSKQQGRKVEQTAHANGNNKADDSDTQRHSSTLGLLSFRGPSPWNTKAGRQKENADEAASPSRSNLRHKQHTFNISPVDSWSKQTVTDITEKHSRHTQPGKVSSLGKTCFYRSPLEPDSVEDSSPQALSLKEALQLFRPDFISRSQGRVRRLERRSRRRRALQDSNPDLVQGLREDGGGQKRNCTTPDPLSNNLFRPRERSISGREMQLRSRRIYNKLPEVTKKKEEEKRRAVSQTNRLRAEVFKKRLLEQVLQR